jgi:hypothetical protein
MPFEDFPSSQLGAPPPEAWKPTETPPESPSWGATFGAAFQQENILVGGYYAGTGSFGPPDPDFNASKEIKGGPYEPYKDRFDDVQNRAHFLHVTRNIDREVANRKILAAAPWWQSLLAEGAANLADPTNLIGGGFGAFGRGAKGGFSVLRSGAAVGLGVGAGTAAQEAILHGEQQTRTLEESAIGVGSSIVLGGAIGAGLAPLLTHAEWRAATRSIDRDLARTSPQSIRENPATAPVYEDMKSQLLGAPNRPAWLDEDYADKVATLTAARYQARAERLGGDATAESLYRGEGIGVRQGVNPEGPAGIEMRGPTAPQIFDQFAGQKAKTANTDVLDKARQMADEGYWPQDVWEQTGWYRGTDGKWRFEISDDKATLGKLPEFGVDRTLGEVLIHPQLYEAYPELANMRVYTVKGLGSAYTHPDAAGAGEAIRLQGAHPDLKYDIRSHLLHEVEHAIQRREAFAQGAEELKAGPDVYHRTAGEVEARNVEQRRDMTPEERLANPPWRTEDVPAGQQLFQRGAEPKGRIILQTNKAIIDLFASADKSTFLHELGHLWLDELSRDAARANVPQALKDDLGSILRWLGVDKIEDIKRPQHEQWATAFERYLNEGKAPSSALAQAFESFKQWLTTIYKSLTDVNATITDDIRGVMDRMLASDREIAAAQARVERSGFGASVGAAAVSVPSTGEAAIAGRMAGGLARVTSWISPGLRLAHSDSPVARDAGFNLFEFTSYLKQNDNGIASPTAVETLRKAWEGKFNEALQDHQKAYSDYRKRVGSGGLLQRVSSIFRDDDTTSFNGQVGRAMRQEDTHAEPEIARAAASWRKNVIEPFTKAALEEKLFPAEIADRIAQGLPPSTAPSYFPRLWNRNRLVAEEGAFKREVVDWALESMPSWERASANAIEKRLAPLRSEIDDLEMAKLRRGEEARVREEEIQTGEYTEGDIRSAIRMVRGGAQKPKGVKTLTQFVVESGGLWDPGGDVRGMGAGPRSRPGLLRAERRRAQNPNGGWALDDMARHAWESGYFPNKVERPSVNEFLDALSDDFNKRRAVLRDEDRDAYRMTELVNQIEQDLSRLGVGTEGSPRFATSEETKGIVKRVYDAMNARDDRRLEDLRAKLKEREAESRVDHEARFGDPNGHAREIADDVFNKLTGKSIEGPLPEFVTVNARGPLKERTFNIPDARVERWLESDAELVLDRYQRTMSADIELARKFGTPDMKDALTSVQQDYLRLREGVADPKQLTKMDGQEKADIRDLTAVRDLIRGNYKLAEWERGFGQVARMATAVEYMMKMGQVVISSLTEPVRVVAARGLVPFVKDGMAVLGNLDAFKLSAAEAKLAGNISDRLRGGRVFSLADLGDYYGTRGVMDKFLANMTNVASTLNGIRIWTDGEKMFASTMIQNKMLRTAVGYAKASAEDRRYLAFLGIDEGMASRIAKQFADHGEDSKGVFVAGTREWTDDIAVRQYRAALNKDLDSMVVTRGVADVPLFANTPLGRMLFQFRTFNISSHQRMLLRGLQEDQARFLSGVVAMSSFGMLQMYVAAVATNSQSKFPNGAEGLAASMQKNPGWWIGEGLDHSGLLTIPFEISNAVEKLTGGVNPLKAPLKAFDEGNAISVKNRPRNAFSMLGPTAATLLGDVPMAAAGARKFATGEEVGKGEKNAAERLLPFNSYYGLRQFLKYFVNPPDE